MSRVGTIGGRLRGVPTNYNGVLTREIGKVCVRLRVPTGRPVRRLGGITLSVGLLFVTVSCGSDTQGRQLDIVLRTQIGSGNETAAPAPFPHARYTFFAFEDPMLCLAGVQLLDTAGKIVGGETFDRRRIWRPSMSRCRWCNRIFPRVTTGCGSRHMRGAAPGWFRKS